LSYNAAAEKGLSQIVAERVPNGEVSEEIDAGMFMYM
jgi:hypothetical protein